MKESLRIAVGYFDACDGVLSCIKIMVFLIDEDFFLPLLEERIF